MKNPDFKKAVEQTLNPKKMKIAIASESKDKNSNVSDMAGRAACYLIFDENLNLIETADNPFRFGSGGAGFAVAKMLADKKVGIIIAGRLGPNMVQALEERGVKYYEKSGNIEKALAEVLKAAL